MRTIKIYAYVDNDAKELLSDFSIKYCDSYEDLCDKLDKYDYINPRIAIIDEKFLKKNGKLDQESIKKDLMYKATAVVAYAKKNSLSLEDKRILYGFDFKGIIVPHLENHHKVLGHVVRTANLYANNFVNNFIRGMSEFFELEESNKLLSYLLNRVVEHYDIDNKIAAELHLVIFIFLIAIKENKYEKVERLLKVIFKSQKLATLVHNIKEPKTFEEKIISTIIFMGGKIDKNIGDFSTQINQKLIDEEIFETIDKFDESKALFVASYQDINFFWEELDMLLSKKRFSFENEKDLLLSDIRNTLQYLLYSNSFLDVKVHNIKEDGFDVCIDTIGIMSNHTKEYLNVMEHKSKNISIDMKKNTIAIRLSENIQDIQEQVKELKETSIDTSHIDRMHYTDDTKISATKFLEEFEVDNYLLDDLSETEEEVRSQLIAGEAVTTETMEYILKALSNYVKVLHGTIEFDDISGSLESLVNFLDSLDLETLQENKKQELGIYMQGLIDDLSSWRVHIFIDKNTSDIHYLDASLLENCAEIESLIVNDTTSSDEDSEEDLEFF